MGSHADPWWVSQIRWKDGNVWKFSAATYSYTHIINRVLSPSFQFGSLNYIRKKKLVIIHHRTTLKRNHNQLPWRKDNSQDFLVHQSMWTLSRRCNWWNLTASALVLVDESLFVFSIASPQWVSEWVEKKSDSKGLTLPETNSSLLKMDGWNTSLSYWGPGLFSGAFAVSFRKGNPKLLGL